MGRFRVVKNFLFLILFLPVLVSGCFKDTSDPVVCKAKFEGLVDGYTTGEKSGKYLPGDEIIRSEFMKMFIKAMKIDMSKVEEYQEKKCFNDVSTDDWYNKYICYAKAKGIISPNKNFNPSDKINFSEASKILLVGLLKYEKSNKDNCWKMDNWKMNDVWHDSYTKSMNNIMNENKKYNDPVTRKYFIIMLRKLIEKKEYVKECHKNLGVPLGMTRTIPGGGTHREYDNGKIYVLDGETITIYGKIWEKYNNLGKFGSWLGKPVSNSKTYLTYFFTDDKRSSTKSSYDYYQKFEKGTLYARVKDTNINYGDAPNSFIGGFVPLIREDICGIGDSWNKGGTSPRSNQHISIKNNWRSLPLLNDKCQKDYGYGLCESSPYGCHVIATASIDLFYKNKNIPEKYNSYDVDGTIYSYNLPEWNKFLNTKYREGSSCGMNIRLDSPISNKGFSSIKQGYQHGLSEYIFNPNDLDQLSKVTSYLLEFNSLKQSLIKGRPITLQYEYTVGGKPTLHLIVLIGITEDGKNIVVQDSYYPQGEPFISLKRAFEYNRNKRKTTQIKLMKFVTYENF